MIEIICKENQQEEQEIKLPKNIRQIGCPQGRHKIYMEDYVYTYLTNQAKAGRKSAAVLFGKSCISKGMRYTFINGAVECGQAVFQFDSIYLDESFWEYIDAEGQEYFKDAAIVGWFVGKQEEGAVLSPSVESAHRKYFAGRDKVLMLMDAEEDEELFYIYEQGYLQKREGYYIYYEKNIAMQEYMVRKKEEQRQLEPFRQYSQQEENKKQVTEPFTPIDKIEEMEKLETRNRLEEIEVIEDVKKTGGIEKTENGEWEQLHKEIRENTAPEEETVSNWESRTISVEEVRGLEEQDSKILGEGTISLEESEKEEAQDVTEKIFVKSSLEEHVSEAEKALQNYRHTLQEKRGHKVERQNKRFLYTAASFFMIAFCIVGITTINNYNKMKEVEEVLYVMKGEDEKESTQKEKDDLVVQSVASEVTPLEETNAKQSADAQQSDAQSQNQPQNQESTAQPQAQQPAQQQPAQPQAQQPETQQPEAQPQAQQPETQQQPAQSQQPEAQQPEAQPQAQQPAAPQYYTVQAGETLESICLKIYQDKSKVAALCQANGIQNGNQIQAGQKLLLP